MSRFPLGLISQTAGGAAGAGAMELISTTILSVATNTITFSSIPGTYKHLQLRMTVASDRAATSDRIFMRLNGDTTTSYAVHGLYGSNGFGSGINNSSFSGMNTSFIPASTYGVSNMFAGLICDFTDYSSTVKNKVARFLGGMPDFSASAYSYQYSGLWINTGAITSITMIPNQGTNFIAGSRFSLYGIKG